MNAIAPHPSGIIGFIPGIATSSLAVGGLAEEGGDISDVMNTRIKRIATINIENKQTHKETSP
jgi:hypothetical protein